MNEDDFFAAEDSRSADNHSDSGLGLGGGDDALDYLLYEEVTKEADRKTKQKSGCLSMLVMVLVPLGIFGFWKIF